MNTLIGLTKPTPESLSVPSLVLEERTGRRSAAVRFRRLTVACEMIADLVTVVLTIMTSYQAYYRFDLGRHVYYHSRDLIGISLAVAVLIVMMLDRVGAYRHGNSLLHVRETERVLRVCTEAALLAFAASFFAGYLFSRWLLLINLILVPFLLFVEKHLLYLLVQALHSRGYGIERVLVYGSGSSGRRVYSVLTRSPKLGMEPVAFVDDDLSKVGAAIFEMGYQKRRCAKVVGGPAWAELVEQYAADLVIIAIPSIPHTKFTRTIREVLSTNARVSFVPNHLLTSDPWVDYEDIDGVFLGSFDRSSRRVGYHLAKRGCDLLLSGLLLLLGSPIFLLLMILVKLDSRGPALFRQERVGQDGVPFRMYKFRTMYTDAPAYEFSPKRPNDTRITRIGKFLRRTSLDELPQLFNVLRGEMSLVGPRPEMPFIVAQYAERHRQRLQVKPGITGLWQLSGDRAYLIHENIEYDLYYLRHCNFFMDIAILLHTLIFAMRGI